MKDHSMRVDKEVSTPAKYIFQPLLVKWEIRKPFAHAKGKFSIGSFCNYPSTQSVYGHELATFFVM